MNPNNETELTERELAIAKHAAKIAVEEIASEFYRSVGKAFITRVLVVLGAAVVAYAMGKGWIGALVKG